MKKGKANILIVDSEESVRSIFSEKLQADGYDCTVAANSEKALETASTQDFDVIILDANIPGLSGMEALPRIITDHPNTCVLLTSSTADPQTAVEAIQLGAADYIPKPLDPDELEKRVKKALDKKKKQINESKDALRESENRFKLLSEAMSDGYFVIQNLEVIFANDRSAEILGYTAKEITGKSIQELLTPEVIKELWKIHKKRLGGESAPITYETHLPKKDGTLCPVELSVRLIDHEGKQAASVILRDITERKEAEEALQQSEALYRLLAENVSDVIWTLNMKGQLTYISPSITAQRGFTVEEEMAHTIEEMVAPDSIDTLRKGFSEALSSHDSNSKNVFNSQTLEMELNCKDGSTIWTESSVTYLRDSNGKPIGILGVTRDIDERKKAEKTIYELDKKYNLLADNITDAILHIDMNLNILYISPSVTRLHGYTIEELMTPNLIMDKLMSTPEDIETHWYELYNHLNSENADQPWSKTLEFEIQHKEGHIVWIEVTVNYVMDPETHKPGVVGVARDITKRKEAEKASEQSEAYFRSLIENAQDGVIVIDIDGVLKYQSPSLQRIMGYSPEKNQLENVHPDDIVKSAVFVDQLIKEPDSIINDEIRARHSDGSWRICSVTGRNFLDDPAVEGIVINISDITESKKAEEQLKEQEQYFKALIEHSFDAVSVLNADGSTRYQSPIMQRLLGYDPVENTDQTALEFVHPEDVPKCIDLFEQLLSKPLSTVQTELRIKRADGTWITCEVMGKNLIDDPIVQGILTNLSDITERKQAEDALAEAEARFRLLAENATDVIWTRDLDLRPTYISPSVTRIRGFTVEEALAQTPEETMPPDSLELAQRTLIEQLELIKSGKRDPSKAETVELEVYCKDGSTIWTEVKVTTLLDSDGEPNGILGLTRDINERKQAEEALRESEERYRLIAENISDVITVTDSNLNIQYISPSIMQLRRCTPEEAMNLSIKESMTSESFQHMMDTMVKDLSEIEMRGEYPKRSSLIEIEAYRKDGSIVPVEMIHTFMWGSQGELNGFVTAMRDISERKQAEEALRESEERYRLITENISDIIAFSDANLNMTYVSPSITRVLRCTLEEAMAISIEKAMTPESYQKMMEIVTRDFSQTKTPGEFPRTSSLIEVEVYRKDGSIVPLEMVHTFVYGENGELNGFVTAMRDISERKQAEQALKAQEEYYQALIENSIDAIVIIDSDGMIRYQSPSFGRMLDIQFDDKDPFEYVHPEDLPKATELFEKMLSSGPDEIIHYTVRAFHNDGSLRDLEVIGQNLIDNPTVNGILVTIHDITDRIQAEQALQESEERYRLIAENIADVIYLMDKNLNLIYVSPSVMSLRGYSADEVLSGDLMNAMPPDSQQHVTEVFERLLKSVEKGLDWSEKFEVEVNHKNGHTIWTEGTFSPFYDLEGQLIGFMGTMRDISERKQADQALKESEERYRLLAENASDVIWTMNMDLEFTYISPAIVRQRGFTVEEAMTHKVQDIMTPESFDFVAKELGRELAMEREGKGDPRRIKTVELDYICKDGSTVPVELTATFLRDNNGKATGILGMTRDISERKQAEQAIRESEERYRLLAENVTDVIWIMDLNLKYSYLSPSVQRLRGFTVEEAMSQTIEESLTPESLEAAMNLLSEELAIEETEEKEKSRVGTLELEMTCKDGSTVITETTATFLRDDTGQATGILGVSRDITERKKADESLRKSEEYFRSLTQSISDVIVVLNGDLSIKYKSPTFDTINPVHGGSQLYESSSSQQQLQEIINKHLNDISNEWSIDGNLYNFIHPEDIPMAAKVLSKIMENPKEPVHIEIRGNYQDDSWHSYEVIAKNLLDDPTIEGILVTFRDITDRKSAEEATKEAEKRYQAIFDNRLQMVYIYDQDGRFLDANDFALERMGYTRDEIGKIFFQDIVHPDDLEKAYAEVADVMATGRMSNSLEVRINTRSGDTIWIETFAIPLESSSDHLIGLGLASDITERKRAEQALQHRTNQILALQEVTSSIQSTLNLKEILQRVSDSIVNNLDFEHAFIFMLDEKTNTHRGTTYATRGGDELIQNVQEIIHHALTQIEIPNIRGYSQGMEMLLDGKTHITHSLSDIAMPPFTKEECDSIQNLVEVNTWVNLPITANDKLLGSLLAFTGKDDITENDVEPLELLADRAGTAIENARLFQETEARAAEIRSLNEELEQRVMDRTAQLEVANRELESFAYSVSHDLRAPLRSIDGFSNMLLEDYSDMLDDQGRDYLQRVSSNTRRMTQLIDGILDLSRMTRGELEYRTVDISELATSISEDLQQQQPERQVEFLITPGLVVNGDMRLLRAAFENLLGNAWKFTSKCEKAKIEFGHNQINERFIYYIRDNGAGFDMANAERLFGTFQRLHTNEEFEGTGIGLATVQRIIRRHGGDVWAEGEVGKGATFYFTLE